MCGFSHIMPICHCCQWGLAAIKGAAPQIQTARWLILTALVATGVATVTAARHPGFYFSVLCASRERDSPVRVKGVLKIPQTRLDSDINQKGGRDSWCRINKSGVPWEDCLWKLSSLTSNKSFLKRNITMGECSHAKMFWWQYSLEAT